MKAIKYFAVGLVEDLERPGESGYDIDICVRAMREPTTEEAAEFLKADIQKWFRHPLYVSDIFEVSSEIAHKDFSWADEEKTPIFGA